MFTPDNFGTPQRIQRANRAVPERIITWREQPEFHHFDPELNSVPVWIDVLRLDAMLPLSRTMEHVGFAGENGISGRYAGVDKFMRQRRRRKASEVKIEMPWVRIEPANDKHPNQKIVTIINGRHRFAWMRDHGSLALPVSALMSEATDVAKLVGTQERICRVRMWEIPEWHW